MFQESNIAVNKHVADNVNASDIEASAGHLSSTVRRWVGGSVGYVYHTDNTRHVGGCAGSVHGF